MLNYLWAGMMIIGILWGAFHGQLPAVTEGALQSSKEAVTLCITMLGVMSLWTGVLEIGHRSGLVDQLAGRMSPLLTFLFPRLSPQGMLRPFAIGLCIMFFPTVVLGTINSIM